MPKFRIQAPLTSLLFVLAWIQLFTGQMERFRVTIPMDAIPMDPNPNTNPNPNPIPNPFWALFVGIASIGIAYRYQMGRWSLKISPLNVILTITHIKFM